MMTFLLLYRATLGLANNDTIVPVKEYVQSTMYINLVYVVVLSVYKLSDKFIFVSFFVCVL